MKFSINVGRIEKHKLNYKFGSGTGSQRTSASGFTLVETLIASVAAATMLLTLYASFGVGYSMMKVTREDLRANQIILQRMEAIRVSGFNQLKDPTKYPASVTEYYSESGKTNGNGGIAYTVTYNTAPGPTTLPPSYRTNVLVVTVGASWTSGNIPRSRSVQMQTYVASHGIQPYVAGTH